MNQLTKEFATQLLSSSLRQIANTNPQLVQDAIDSTKFLPIDAPLRQRLWHIANSKLDLNVCLECDKLVTWCKSRNLYNKYCSNKCSTASSALRVLKKQTMLARYGVDNIFKDRPKIEAACRAKFGTSHPKQSEIVQARYRARNIEKYGVEHPWILPEIRNKCVETRDYQFITDVQKQQLTDKLWMEAQLITASRTLSDVAEELGVAQSTVGLYAVSLNIDHVVRSKAQQRLFDWLCTISDDVIQNDRTTIPPYELDIVLPYAKVAVELNGVYWHGDSKGKDKTYHLAKRKLAFAAGYHLIQITDVEWDTQPAIVKSRLQAAIGLNTTIFARSCIVRALSTSEERLFFNANHIQGYVHSQRCFGLEHNGIVVAAISFCASRFNRAIQHELLRYASVLDHNVVGGASKLFTYFLRNYNPTSVISYCDLRWGTGRMYQMLNFTHTHDSAPNYQYFKQSGSDQKVLFSRQTFQKHKLKDKLPIFDAALTEWENMQANGYDRIWDCGNSVWLWQKDCP